MKNYLKVFLLIIFTLILCSCKEKEEYHLIELTSQELINNMFTEDNKSFIFAAINIQEDGYEQFLKDLNNLSKSAKKDIYYIDYYHMDIESSVYLYNIDGADFSTNSYYAYKNGKFEVAEYYTDFSSMYSSVKNFKTQGDITKISKDKKESALKEAKKLYQEGKISLAFDTLNKAIDLEEAKKEYNNNKYYKLLISWENFDFKDKSMTRLTYYSLIFYHGVNYFSIANKDTTYDENFDKEFNYEDYEQLFYYVKDDIIYTSKSEDGKYRATYKITYFDSNHLDIRNISSNKEYSFVRRT